MNNVEALLTQNLAICQSLAYNAPFFNPKKIETGNGHLDKNTEFGLELETAIELGDTYVFSQYGQGPILDVLLSCDLPEALKKTLLEKFLKKLLLRAVRHKRLTVPSFVSEQTSIRQEEIETEADRIGIQPQQTECPLIKSDFRTSDLITILLNLFDEERQKQWHNNPRRIYKTFLAAIKTTREYVYRDGTSEEIPMLQAILKENRLEVNHRHGLATEFIVTLNNADRFEQAMPEQASTLDYNIIQDMADSLGLKTLAYDGTLPSGTDEYTAIQNLIRTIEKLMGIDNSQNPPQTTQPPATADRAGLSKTAQRLSIEALRINEAILAGKTSITINGKQVSVENAIEFSQGLGESERDGLMRAYIAFHNVVTTSPPEAVPAMYSISPISSLGRHIGRLIGRDVITVDRDEIEHLLNISRSLGNISSTHMITVLLLDVVAEELESRLNQCQDDDIAERGTTECITRLARRCARQTSVDKLREQLNWADMTLPTDEQKCQADEIIKQIIDTLTAEFIRPAQKEATQQTPLATTGATRRNVLAAAALGVITGAVTGYYLQGRKNPPVPYTPARSTDIKVTATVHIAPPGPDTTTDIASDTARDIATEIQTNLEAPDIASPPDITAPTPDLTPEVAPESPPVVPVIIYKSTFGRKLTLVDFKKTTTALENEGWKVTPKPIYEIIIQRNSDGKKAVIKTWPLDQFKNQPLGEFRIEAEWIAE
ncbi:MAG: hypothetical protein ABIH78_04420 [Candidatus Peregrinibacteria bacterium]